MRDFLGKRYWMVGATEGLGLALAKKLNAAGAEVILSGRDETRLAEAVASLPIHARGVRCDVADRDSVKAAAREVGEIDGLVFLAGVYWPMKAQAWNAEQVEAMLDVNLIGAARVLGEVLPAMVARDRGHVVLTGSLSGFRGLPGAIGYAPSKAGVMSLAESMYADLRGSGVEVQLANPGFIRTRLTAKNDFKMPFIMEPEEAARDMFEHMCGDAFQRSFPTLFALFFRLARFLPDGIYYRIFG